MTGPGNGYAAGLINSKRKGRTNQFGWLQAPATNYLVCSGLENSTSRPFFFSWA
jgi:hypothetical protein